MYTKNLLAFALTTVAASAQAQTCAQDPDTFAKSCLQAANSQNGNTCSSDNFACLCEQIDENGNFSIYNGKCVSDGCINTGSENAYTSASVYQKSLCASATASATESAPSATITSMTRKRDDPQCGSDPGSWAKGCLQSANDDTGDVCSDNDFTCLCKQNTANANFAISNGKCVSDGCINNPGGGGSAGYSSASSYQASFCSSVIATPSGSIVSLSPTPTSASGSSPMSSATNGSVARLSFEQTALAVFSGLFALSLMTMTRLNHTLYKFIS